MSQPKLDPEEFLVPSHDLHDATVQLCFGVPPLLDKAINEVISSRKFPFVTKDELIRWCTFEGIKSLESMRACVSNLPILDLLVIVTRIEVSFEKFEELFVKLDRALFEISTSGYQAQNARRLAKAIEELFLCLSSSRNRNWFLSELRRRWGHLLLNSEPPQVGEAEGAEPSGGRGARDGR